MDQLPVEIKLYNVDQLVSNILLVLLAEIVVLKGVKGENGPITTEPDKTLGGPNEAKDTEDVKDVVETKDAKVEVVKAVEIPAEPSNEVV